ncbi:uncharacterized protein B0I36DRAFT_404448 [Microdochium trichocladiopsis]|uniref:BZIP domain-containing protein n=1 Tax=Microdochium trichocladiopsis TaxID=1682393 RepID=A0A9P8XP46_9PEZI|nr:uncharacterized protein B0I36DRAFT_404448 [Microdochium trichocladiopsis]KAH7007964.1 hypothetical protein B0I36DRAFT_404448 [Microdochium trichocladiopsis]
MIEGDRGRQSHAAVTMAGLTDPTLHQPSTRTIECWSGDTLDLGRIEFSDMSQMVFDSKCSYLDVPFPAADGGFIMDLGPEMYNMPLQPYDVVPVGTIAASQISNPALDDNAWSTHSWPISPISDSSTLSNIASASNHTSPSGSTLEPSSLALRCYSYHQLQQQHSSEIQQLAGTKHRHSEIHVHSAGSADATASFASQSTPSNRTAVPSSNKKKTIREKNRSAATKYRNKMKCETTELQETEKQLSEKNSTLSAHVQELRDEILALKMEILRHSTCNDQGIQAFILGEIRKLIMD